MIDPGSLEDLPEYPRMSGAFGTLRVTKLNGDLLAVKELRISGDQDDRSRFAMVRVPYPAFSSAYLEYLEIRERAQSVGSA